MNILIYQMAQLFNGFQTNYNQQYDKGKIE